MEGRNCGICGKNENEVQGKQRLKDLRKVRKYQSEVKVNNEMVQESVIAK